MTIAVPANRDILGLPLVPPPRLTMAAMALRRYMAVVQRRMAPGQIRILEGLFGLFDNRVLGLLVEFGIPEFLDEPRTIDELAGLTRTDRDALERVLRFAAGRGFLRLDRNRRYRANDLTKLLRRDHPNSWRGWVEFLASDWQWEAWRHADAPLNQGMSGMEAATGVRFFDFVNRSRPDAGEAFNSAMAAGATIQALALSHGLNWSGVETVCDVGGGTGAALEYLLAAHSHLSGVLLDLPEVISHGRHRLRKGDLATRCQFVAGSFFDELPVDCDRYLLLAVVHDWADTEVVAILGRLHQAMKPGSRAVVVENVLGDRPRGDAPEATHLLMRVLVAGRERTDREYAALFHRASFTIEQRRMLATGFTAFVLSPT